MVTITLEKMNKDIQEIKIILNKLTHLMEEDLELNTLTKKELKSARKEPLTKYIDHQDVLEEFA